MLKRIRRIDPMQSPPGGRAPSGAQTVDAAGQGGKGLDYVLAMLFAGKALLHRIDEYHGESAPDPFQEYWNRFRLALVAAEALPVVQFQASSLPVPFLEMVDQFFLQNVVVRLASILDEKLEEVIDARGLPIGKRPRLAHRIDAVRDAGLVTNAADLHALRELRNEIGHEAIPTVVEWPYVISAADAVEHAFLELGLATASPRLKVEEITFTKIKPSEREHEIGRRDVVLSISADGSPFCSFRWPYVYFMDPPWRP